MTLPNFSEYVPPGVYWQQQPLPRTVQTTGLPNGVAIVGPSLGYRTYSEAVTLTSTDPVTLASNGIIQSSVVVSMNGTVYLKDVDYTLTKINNTKFPTDPYSNTTITRIDHSGGIPNGATVTVTYNYTDSTYSSPTQVTDYNSAANLYGPSTDPSDPSAIVSPLSLAAQYALDNGATEVFLVSVPWSDNTKTAVTASDLLNGINKLAAQEGVSIVVPLPVGLTGTSGANLIGFATSFSDWLTSEVATNNVFMMGILGYESGLTFNSNPATNLSKVINNERVVVTYPNNITVYNNNATQTVGGYYLAAAVAGLMASQPVQDGITKKNLRDIVGIEAATFNAMTNTYKNSLAAGGITVVELTRQGMMQVRHGITTDSSSVYSREISLVRSRDDMVDTILQSMKNSGLIGSPIGPNTAATIAGMVNIVLANLELTGVIAKFSSISVTERSINPTIMDVTFVYVPSYPLNYITVTFGIDTSSGSLTGSSTNSTGNITPAG